MSEVTIVVPAYNEAENLPILYNRLYRVMQSLAVDWELIVVDDHSSDTTFAVMEGIAIRDERVRAIRLARNYGSHAAITCGLHRARGACAIVLAADLQDPPEAIPQILNAWRDGAHVVWAARGRREGENASTIYLARAYYYLMRHFVGLREMPVNGADFFLVDRRVLDAFIQFRESSVSIMALIAWIGFRQVTITYTKEARLHGRSGWTLEKKLKLALDSITSFSYLPIRFMSYAGFAIALLGLLYAAVVVAIALAGRTAQGWASLMVIVLVVGGLQMLMMGVLGEYLWRALEESRRRPRYVIEDTIGATDDVPHPMSQPQLHAITANRR